MRARLSQWLGVEPAKAGKYLLDYLLDPDDRKSKLGERLIIFVACCEAVVLLSACSFGLWLYCRSR